MELQYIDYNCLNKGKTWSLLGEYIPGEEITVLLPELCRREGVSNVSKQFGDTPNLNFDKLSYFGCLTFILTRPARQSALTQY